MTVVILLVLLSVAFTQLIEDPKEKEEENIK